MLLQNLFNGLKTMRVINNQIFYKIIFFGTALAGKTTSLKWLCDNTIPDEMKTTKNIRSVNTSFGQTMLFDFVPIKISDNINFRFFASTGQDYYASTRKLLFRDVDGVFFVIDSQKKELEHNKEFVTEFNNHMTHYNLDHNKVTTIVLCNKQNLTNIYDKIYLINELQLEQFSTFETSAITGSNLKNALTVMIEKCLNGLNNNGQ